MTRQLKTTDRNIFRGKQFDFNTTYVHKDRTFLEQTQHRQLVLQLKKKISEDPSIKWIIQFWRIEAGGTFKCTMYIDFDPILLFVVFLRHFCSVSCF